MAKKKPLHTVVTVRLRTEDVKKLKDEAAADGEAWQPRLRGIVHRAVWAHREIR